MTRTEEIRKIKSRFLHKARFRAVSLNLALTMLKDIKAKYAKKLTKIGIFLQEFVFRSRTDAVKKNGYR